MGDIFVLVFLVNGVYLVGCLFKYYCLCGIVIVGLEELNVFVGIYCKGD